MVEALPHGTGRLEVTREPGGCIELDPVAVEGPLEIRIGGEPIAVTMRTPGHDEELALGFCVSEGIPATAAAPPRDLAANVVDVEAGAFDRSPVQRSFYTSPPCGGCGQGALEAGARPAPPGPGPAAATAVWHCAASSAAAGSTSTARRGASGADGRPARRRRLDSVRLAQGGRAPRRRDARGTRVADARRGLRAPTRGRQGGRAARPPL